MPQHAPIVNPDFSEACPSGESPRSWNEVLQRLRTCWASMSDSLEIDACPPHDYYLDPDPWFFQLSTSQLPRALSHFTFLRTLKITGHGNGMQVLPAWLGNLSSLEHLDLSNCDLVQLPSEWHAGTFCRLKTLKLSQNRRFHTLPRWLGSISSLEELCAEGCDVRTLPEWSPAFFPALCVLRLRGNRSLKTLPSWIADLPRLKLLSASECPLMDSAPDVTGNAGGMSKLHRATHTEHMNGPPERFDQSDQVATLRSLDCSKCGLLSFPAMWRPTSMHSVEEVCLSDNPSLKRLPPWLCSLPSLRRLDASRCGLIALPAHEYTGALPTVETLLLGGNPALASLPDWVGFAPKLKSLDVSECGLTSLPAEWRRGGLQALETLDISGNPGLQELPDWLCSLPNLKELVDAGCGNYPDSWRTTPNAFPRLGRLNGSNDPHLVMREHFDKRFGAPDLCVKVAVLGQGGVGKSKLSQRLAGRSVDRTAVPTRDLDLLVVPNGLPFAPGGRAPHDLLAPSRVRVHIVDFGGQPWLLGPHEFFLSDQRSVYIVVCRSDWSLEDNHVAHWISTVTDIHAQWQKWRELDNPRPPILVVVTHSICSDRRLDRRRLRTMCDQDGVLLVDDYDNHEEGTAGLECVRASLQLAIEDMNELATTRLSRTWRRVRDDIERRFSQFEKSDSWAPWLTWNNFVTLYHGTVESGAESDAEARRFAGLLRDLGLVHWLGDRQDLEPVDSAVETVLFNPHFVKVPAYRVLDRSLHVAHEAGKPWQVRKGEIARLVMGALQQFDRPDLHSDETCKLLCRLLHATQVVWPLDGESVCVPDRMDEGILPPERDPETVNELWIVVQDVLVNNRAMSRIVGELAPMVEHASRTVTRLRRDGGAEAKLVADAGRSTVWCKISGGSDADRNRLLGQLEGPISRALHKPLSVLAAPLYDTGTKGTKKARPTMPSPRDLKVHALLRGGMSREQAAAAMRSLGFKFTASQVRRAVLACDRWLDFCKYLPTQSEAEADEAARPKSRRPRIVRLSDNIADPRARKQAGSSEEEDLYT